MRTLRFRVLSSRLKGWTEGERQRREGGKVRKQWEGNQGKRIAMVTKGGKKRKEGKRGKVTYTSYGVIEGKI